MMILASMINYKHTYQETASILTNHPHNMPSMDEKFDLDTKAGRIGFVIKQSGNNPSTIAKLVGCEPAAVYQWLNGSTKNLKEHLLWKLADVTGYEARWISMGEGPAKIDKSIKHANEVLLAMQPEARYTAVRLLDTLAEPRKNNGTQ